MRTHRPPSGALCVLRSLDLPRPWHAMTVRLKSGSPLPAATTRACPAPPLLLGAAAGGAGAAAGGAAAGSAARRAFFAAGCALSEVAAPLSATCTASVHRCTRATIAGRQTCFWVAVRLRLGAASAIAGVRRARSYMVMQCMAQGRRCVAAEEAHAPLRAVSEVLFGASCLHDGNLVAP